MVVRSAFAILDETYRWIGSYEVGGSVVPRRLPEIIKSELSAAVNLSIHVEADLEAPRWPRAYMADASESGYGCDCDPEETRAGAARGTERLWGPQ
eukprot:6972648-Pyramimonas_sp.AAC.1